VDRFRLVKDEGRARANIDLSDFEVNDLSLISVFKCDIVSRMSRRQAVLKFCQFVAASPLLKADRKYSELGDPLLKQVNVFDFARLAKAKLDPLAWDYLDEGSDDEVSLRANRSHFDNIVIRPHFLINDVSTIDTSITLFGKKLTQPIYFSITGGKNCFIPNGEQETALAAGTSNSMMITGGGINDILSAGKGPKV